MSLRRSANVTPKPPKGGLKGDDFLFPYKNGLRSKKAAKFVCVKTVSGKVVRHSLVYLSVHKWLVEDVPFYLKFSNRVTHPHLKRRFSVYIRS